MGIKANPPATKPVARPPAALSVAKTIQTTPATSEKFGLDPAPAAMQELAKKAPVADPLTNPAGPTQHSGKKPKQEPKLERQHLPAGMPRARASLSEKSKAPSIGGLIHSLQAKPSKAPYYTAAITSAIWLFIGGLLGWLLVGQSLDDFSGYKSVLGSSSVYILAAAVLVPIALFWFIAQLVVRSQEMKLMASAMTEVAVRLAEPDKMAEQRVASVGQTIRRQVSAMDDAIGRAIGRAGELEALVHNEVAALERSYSQNEYIIRNLLNELVVEREAIAHNSHQVKQTLEGVGAQVSKNIRIATDSIGEDLTQHGTMTAMKLQQAGAHVTKALKTTNDQSIAIKQKISAELPQLLTKMNVEQEKLGKVIDAANTNLGQLDTSLAERTTDIDSVISKHTGELNKRLAQKVKALDASLAMRTKSMDKTLATKAGELNKTFLTHREGIDETMQQKAVEINQAIASQAKAMDASLTEKARTIDTALTKRLTTIEEQPAQAEKAPLPARQEQTPPQTPPRSDLSMLRGSEALERAMTDQSQSLHSELDNNTQGLNQTIDQQNRFSREIHTLSEKHTQLLNEHATAISHIREKFAAEGADLQATARLLSGPDMKMSAMMGPQQNKARAVLADIIARSDGLEQSRLSYARTLENSLMLGEETAGVLKQHLTENASPRAEKEILDVDHATALSLFDTQKVIKELETSAHTLAVQVVEIVAGMSRSSNQTKVLPGEVGNTSADVRKSVDEQLQALDALAQISGAAANSSLANAIATNTTTTNSPGPRGQETPHQPANGATPAGARPSPKKRAGLGGKKPSQWSFGDLLARVADTDAEHEEQPLPTYRPATSATTNDAAKRKSGIALDPLDVLSIEDIARALDSHTAALAWQRSQAGERNVFTRRLYTPEGQITFDQISQRYQSDADFQATVETYVADFEGLMKEADEKDPSGRIIQNYLTSETGRTYLMLAHISGRLG